MWERLVKDANTITILTFVVFDKFVIKVNGVGL